MLEPNKIVTNAPTIKKGPKGILVIALAFLVIKAGTLTKLPRSDAIKRNSRANNGLPTSSPSKKPSYTSPPPIHFPSEI